MTDKAETASLVKRIEERLVCTVGPIPVERQSAIGDLAYLYVRCQRFRRLLDSYIGPAPRAERPHSEQRELYGILAEIQNIRSTTEDLGKGLELLLDEAPE